MPQKVEISIKTVVFALVAVLAVWAVTRLTDLLIMLFVAFILMAAINPLVDRLEKLHLHRGLAILLIYIVLWSIIAGLIASVVPTLIDQTTKLIKVLPAAVSHIEFFSSHQEEISQGILSRLGTLPENFLKITLEIFSNLINIFTTLVISFYLLLYHPRLEKYFASLSGKSKSPQLINTTYLLEKRLGGWVRGELFLMLSVGGLTYVGLLALGIDIALPLAILAGILEIIPNIGPTLSAIPAVLITLTLHPLLTVATLALYIIVQTLENHLLVPRIMQSAVGINPLVSILALLVGLRLAGSAGAFLAIPLFITLQAFLPHLRNISLEESKPDSV